jgi:hypothetical protein
MTQVKSDRTCIQLDLKKIKNGKQKVRKTKNATFKIITLLKTNPEFQNLVAIVENLGFLFCLIIGFIF